MKLKGFFPSSLVFQLTVSFKVVEGKVRSKKNITLTSILQTFPPVISIYQRSNIVFYLHLCPFLKSRKYRIIKGWGNSKSTTG